MPRQHSCGVFPPQPAEELRLASDERLAAGIRAGSESHVDVLYDRYFSRVYAFLYARVYDRADAEDLTQVTFAAVFRSIAGSSGRITLLAWIYGIAKNTANNHLRHAHARSARLAAAGPEAAAAERRPFPHEDLERAELLRRMEQRLGGVTRWQAEVFWLRHVDALSIDEIASRIERSNDAIRSSLYRVERLRVEADAAVGGE